MTGTTVPVGLLIGSHIPPQNIGTLARLAEEGGFHEVWVTEDLWYTSGVVSAAAALAATSSINVGLGIGSAVTRHASVQALDFATLSHMYPGRFWPGVGLGLPSWLDQMGLRPASPMTAVRETVGAVQRLLAGESVSYRGVQTMQDIRLAYPVDPPPPMYIGAVGPKAIRQTGAIADGLVSSVLAGAEYLKWARGLLDEAAAEAGRSERPRIVSFALYCGDRDRVAARAALRPVVAFYLTLMHGTDLTRCYGIDGELAELIPLGVEELAARMPDEWLEDLAIVGDAAECAAKVEAQLSAGADAVILFPAPFERGEELIRFAADEVLLRIGPMA